MKAHSKQQKKHLQHLIGFRKRLSIGLLGVCAVSLGVMVLLLPFHAFFSTWLGTTIGPLLLWKSWKEVLLLLLVPLIVVLFILRPSLMRALWARSVNKIIIVYVALHAVFAVFSTASSEAILAGLAMNLRFLAIFLLAQLIVLGGHPWATRLKTLLPQWLLLIAIALSVMAILQVSILPKDFLTHFGYDKDTTIAPFLLVDDTPGAMRAFATMRGPNTLGAYMLLPLAIAGYFLIKKRFIWLSAPALFFGLLALFLSGSRSAWLGFVVMCGVLAVLWLPASKLKKILRVSLWPALVILIITSFAAVTFPTLRLAIFHSSPGDSSLLEGSSEKHWQAVSQGVEMIVRHPLGQGVGIAGPASFYNTNGNPVISENYLVQLGQEVGILGLGLFCVICFLTVRQLFMQKGFMPKLLLASFAGLTVINFLLHGWADDPTAMTWWAIDGLFIASPALVLHNKGSG